MKKVILFDGLPRTGKTTVAALLTTKLKQQGYNAFLYSMKDNIPEYAREHIAYFYAGCVEAFYGFVDNMPEDAIILCDRSPFTELVYGPIRQKNIGLEAMIIPPEDLRSRLKALDYTLLILDNTYDLYIERGAAEKNGLTYSEEAFYSLRKSMLDEAKCFASYRLIAPQDSLQGVMTACERLITPDVQPAIDLAKFMQVQSAFNSRIYDVKRMSKSAKIKRVHEYILALTDETFELLRATKYKLHQPGPATIDRNHAVEEAIDVFKYLLCICELLELGGPEFARVFYYKSEIVDQKLTNFLRQKQLHNVNNR